MYSEADDKLDKKEPSLRLAESATAGAPESVTSPDAALEAPAVFSAEPDMGAAAQSLSEPAAAEPKSEEMSRTDSGSGSGSNKSSIHLPFANELQAPAPEPAGPGNFSLPEELGRKVGIADWLFRLERVFIPEIGRQCTVDSKRSRKEILKELLKASRQNPGVAVPGEDPLSGVRVKTSARTFSLRCKDGFVLWRSLSPFLELRVDDANSRGRIRFRVNNSNYLSTISNAPLAALLATLASFSISSYLMPHPILLFYALLCTLPIPVIACFAAIQISKWQFQKHLPELLAAVSELNGAGPEDAVEIQSADAEVWKEFSRLHAVRDKFIAGAACGAIYLSLAFGLHAAAWNYWAAGDYKKSAEFCQPVAVLVESVLGKDDATVADCKYYLAETYRCMGKIDEALALYKESDVPAAEKLGPENSFRTDLMYNIGRCYEEKKNYIAALANYNQAVRRWAKAFGPDNMLCAKALDRLSVLYLKIGNLTQARESAESALKIDRAYGTKYDATAAGDLNDLAAIETLSGNHELALKHLKEAIALQESSSGDKLSLAAMYINQAHALLGLSKKEEAFNAFLTASRLLSHKQAPAGETLAVKDLEELSGVYGVQVRKHRERYEVPNFDSRAEVTFAGDGNI